MRDNNKCGHNVTAAFKSDLTTDVHALLGKEHRHQREHECVHSLP